MDTSFKTDIPENQGISSKALIEFIDETEKQNLQVTSFMLIRNRKIIAQFWKKPYRRDCLQLLFSLTKSFTSIGVGIVYDKGLIDLEDYVVSFFPDKLPDNPSPNLKKIKIKHLLSMTCGIHENTYSILYPQKDWVKAFLAQDFPHEPGTYYRYSTHASHMLSAIIERVSGLSFFDFVNANLFEPLGITKATWEVCSSGITAGGMGLSLTTESIAKFGQMLLDKGIYNGKRIVSEKYIDLATTKQSDNRTNETGKHKNGYGYQIRIAENSCFFGVGGFGQLCFVAPNEKTVVAVTSRKNNWDSVIDLIYTKILGQAPNESLTSSAESEILAIKLANMAFPVPEFKEIPKDAPDLNNICFTLEDNSHGLRSISFEQESYDQLICKMNYFNRNKSILKFSFIKPVCGKDVFIKDIQYHEQEYVSYAVWNTTNSLELTLFYIETPYVVTYLIELKDKEIKVAFHMNGSINLHDFIVLGKRLK